MTFILPISVWPCAAVSHETHDHTEHYGSTSCPKGVNSEGHVSATPRKVSCVGRRDP